MPQDKYQKTKYFSGKTSNRGSELHLFCTQRLPLPPSSKAAKPPKWMNLMKTILQAPRSQTSSSLGPPAPWRHIPERPRRNAAARYRPGCPPAKTEQRYRFRSTIRGMLSIRENSETMSYIMQVWLFLLCWKAEVLLQHCTILLCLFVVLLLGFLQQKYINKKWTCNFSHHICNEG